MLKQVMEVYDLLSDPAAPGAQVAALFPEGRLDVTEAPDADGHRVDFVSITLPGSEGKLSGGSAPTLGILGTLGGLRIPGVSKGLVSDADGAIVALACALRLEQMRGFGEQYKGDVIVATHVCQEAIEEPHQPYSFMRGPLSKRDMTAPQIDPTMDAILSIDTSRGNHVCNHDGFAITLPVKEGWILKASPDLLRVMEFTTGQAPVVFPIATQDITPYENGLAHINGIMQPATLTGVPVVGVAITTRAVVPGTGTGVAHLTHLEVSGRFCLAAAEAFGAGECVFYDEVEFARLVELYGSMDHLQET